VAGETEGALAGTRLGDRDGFLFKYDGAGNQLWGRQFGTSGYDTVSAVATDSKGNVYVAGDGGHYPGQTQASGAFVAKFDSAGTQLWSNRYVHPTVPELTYFSSLAVDDQDHVTIGGYTWGDFGAPNAGGYDGFVAQLDDGGGLTWKVQFGAVGNDIIHSIAVDGQDIYATGWNELADSAGGQRSLLVKVSVPEPAGAMLCFFTVVGMLRRVRPRTRGAARR
jgi:hypothetical protein